MGKGRGEVEGKSAQLSAAVASFQCGCATCQSDTAAAGKPPWRKVLYVSQPYADNHTDADSFLEDMVMNADISSPSFWPTVEASLVVAHEVAIVALVVAVFAFHFSGVLSLGSLYALNVSFLVGGLLLAALAEADVAALERAEARQLSPPAPRLQGAAISRSGLPASSSPKRRMPGSSNQSPNSLAPSPGRSSSSPVQSALQVWWDVATTCCLIAVHMLLLSPIFHTLTRSISSDTIWCSTTYLLLIHLFLHDYSYSAALSTAFSSYLALLSALIACVLLASRLDSPDQAFVFVSFGLQCFGLLPGILHRVARASHRSHRVVVIMLLCLSSGLLYHLSSLAGAGLVLLLLFVIFACPAILVHMHRSYKSTIQGPWDEAKLQKSKSA